MDTLIPATPQHHIFPSISQLLSHTILLLFVTRYLGFFVIVGPHIIQKLGRFGAFPREEDVDRFPIHHTGDLVGFGIDEDVGFVEVVVVEGIRGWFVLLVLLIVATYGRDEIEELVTHLFHHGDFSDDVRFVAVPDADGAAGEICFLDVDLGGKPGGRGAVWSSVARELETVADEEERIECWADGRFKGSGVTVVDSRSGPYRRSLG